MVIPGVTYRLAHSSGCADGHQARRNLIRKISLPEKSATRMDDNLTKNFLTYHEARVALRDKANHIVLDVEGVEQIKEEDRELLVAL
jgi:hypothetical protein